MNCQDVRPLLAFFDRQSEALDPGERAAIRQHLDHCPDCAELAQAERGFDQAVGAVLRDVAIPGDLKQKVMTRLAAQRGGRRWKWGLATAVAVILLVAGGVFWYNQAVPNVRMADLHNLVSIYNPDKARADEFFKHEGLDAPLPDMFDYQYLQQADVVEFRGRRVAQLTFARGHDCTARVLVLPFGQFRTGDLREDVALAIRHDEAKRVTYLIGFWGNLRSVQIELNQ